MSSLPAAAALSSFFASGSIGLQAAKPNASDAASRLATVKRIRDVMSGQLRLCIGCRSCAGRGEYGVGSEDVEQFDVEDQRGVRFDRRVALLAVGQLAGNPEPVLGADRHHRHALGPAGDHLVQAELGGTAVLFGTVEHG